VAHTCRGTISLHGALIHTVDSCTFVISNGGTQTFHIKGNFQTFIIFIITFIACTVCGNEREIFSVWLHGNIILYIVHIFQRFKKK
jgi:hypothetical protein